MAVSGFETPRILTKSNLSSPRLNGEKKWKNTLRRSKVKGLVYTAWMKSWLEGAEKSSGQLLSPPLLRIPRPSDVSSNSLCESPLHFLHTFSCAVYCYSLSNLLSFISLAYPPLSTSHNSVILFHYISAMKIPRAMLVVHSAPVLGDMEGQKLIRCSPWSQDGYNLLRDARHVHR